MIDRKHVGKTFGRHAAIIDEQSVIAFAKATGHTDPIFVDRAAAQRSGLPSLAIPPTFFFHLNKAGMTSITDWMDALEINQTRILHGEVSFTYLRPVYAGESVVVESRIEDIYASADARYDFVVKETRFSDESGRDLVVERETLIVRL